MNECEARNYSAAPCGPVKFRVVYTSRRTGTVQDEHPACFVHGLAEVDRHDRSGGIALCELKDAL